MRKTRGTQEKPGACRVVASFRLLRHIEPFLFLPLPQALPNFLRFSGPDKISKRPEHGEEAAEDKVWG